MNPLSGSVLAVTIVVVLLKMHSFLVTNQLLAEETLLRRNARRERRANSTPAGLRDANVHPSTDSLNGASETSSRSSLRRTVTLDPRKTTALSAQAPVAVPTTVYSSTTSTRVIAYPKNVTLDNFLYFLVAPVLVYETSYPRTERIRLGYVAWFGVQSVLCVFAQLFLLMQFCVPIFYQSRAADDYEILYYIMKLAIPSLSIWLLFFWGFFHCTLNTIAELLRFADRGFYQDWWNSTTLGSFWRKWNVPVHEWCLRHLYVESVTRRNVRARTASVATFIFSAIMHEYVVATGFKVQPFSLSMPYMFIGMAIQLPLMNMSKHLDHSRKGNLLMWFMLFLGQPLVSILYVRQYIRDRGYLMCQS
jgi:MBOAT, membrane-bound O-acyltransferase family